MTTKETIKVTISGRLWASAYGFDEVSAQSFEVSANRGVGTLEDVFDATLRAVMDQMESEKAHRDKTARLTVA